MVKSSNTTTTTTLHQDVTQCLYSSLAVCYYSHYVDPNGIPVSRSSCPLPSSIRSSDDGEVELVAMEVNELTYAVEVDHTHSIVRISFRGSLTQLDWLHDFNFRMISVRNPLFVHHDVKTRKIIQRNHAIQQTSHFAIHLGFRNYLFGGIEEANPTTTSSSSSSTVGESHATECLAPSKRKDNDCKTWCKYERILDHIRRLKLQKYPEYKVQVCGHSMGGAIATLTAFCLAVDGIPEVTCISIASPRIGNGNFVRAVTELEFAKQLQHLRIVNTDDIVTALPDTTMLAFGLAAHLIRQNFYLHVGICLHMSKEEDADFFYPKVRTHNHVLYDWTHRTKNMAKRVLTFYRMASTNIPQTHHPLEYETRLKHAEKLLQCHSWESLYETYFGHLNMDVVVISNLFSLLLYSHRNRLNVHSFPQMK